MADNGPQFVSKEFKQLMVTNGIKHIRSSLYHPIGTAETQRMVQTLKLALKVDHKGGDPLEKLLVNFLLHYRVMPYATTGIPHVL